MTMQVPSTGAADWSGRLPSSRSGRQRPTRRRGSGRGGTGHASAAAGTAAKAERPVPAVVSKPASRSEPKLPRSRRSSVLGKRRCRTMRRGRWRRAVRLLSIRIGRKETSPPATPGSLRRRCSRGMESFHDGQRHNENEHVRGVGPWRGFQHDGNRTVEDVAALEIGGRASGDEASFPDGDSEAVRDGSVRACTRMDQIPRGSHGGRGRRGVFVGDAASRNSKSRPSPRAAPPSTPPRGEALL